MKKIILASILALGFAYANNAATELEHANKTANSADSIAGDMSKMKAAGKCGADQSAMKKNMKKNTVKLNAAATELEHANKTPTSNEDFGKDMSKMKAAGKCNSGK
jgi:hypothetical protein